jgi:magnesium-transporting ATPase (P-type)
MYLLRTDHAGRQRSVIATGTDTELGRISDLRSAEGEVALLEKRLNQLGYRLVWLDLCWP